MGLRSSKQSADGQTNAPELEAKGEQLSLGGPFGRLTGVDDLSGSRGLPSSSISFSSGQVERSVSLLRA